MNNSDNLVPFISDYVLPLFPGSRIIETDHPSPKKSRMLVARQGPTQLAIRAEPTASSRILIGRSQPFTNDEQNLVKQLIAVYDELVRTNERFTEELSGLVLKAAISRFLSASNSERLLSIISLFESLAGRTYEGQNLSSGVGIFENDESSDISIRDYYTNDFGLVLANGVSSIVIVNQNGEVIGHEVLVETSGNPFAPQVYNAAANWSEQGIVLALNRNNEILIFKDKKMLFSKRRLKWQYYSHDTSIQALAAGNRKSWVPSLRSAIYESILDASFARTGGLIAVAKRPKMKSVKSILDSKDLIASGTTLKAQHIRRVIDEKPFQQLERRLRQELLAIDGAVVLDYQGYVIGAGSIVTRVDATSDGGARSAAAKALARFGIAIKISMDGQITGYTEEKQTVKRYFAYA